MMGGIEDQGLLDKTLVRGDGGRKLRFFMNILYAKELFFEEIV